MSFSHEDPLDDGEGLDLTSEPTVHSESAGSRDTADRNASGGLTHVQVHFRCCKVYWRFPIPTDVLSGAKASWFVYCPRCGSKLQLP